jgi:hypothetical protein
MIAFMRVGMFACTLALCKEMRAGNLACKRDSLQMISRHAFLRAGVFACRYICVKAL